LICRLLAAPVASTMCALIEYVPARIGVPLTVPSDPTLNPSGAPLAVQVYGARPPLPTSDPRNGTPTSADGFDSRAARATTLSVSCFVSTRVPEKSFAPRSLRP
jgi:hypothetical protein